MSAYRLGIQLGICQGMSVNGLGLAVGAVLIDLPLAAWVCGWSAFVGVTLWWRRFGLALTVPWQMYAWAGGSRPCAPHEERRYEKSLARDYSHAAIRYRPCFSGTRLSPLCLRCWRLLLTGAFRRRKAALVAAGRARRART